MCSLCLNVSGVDVCHMSTGSKFQAAGSAMFKALSPNLDAVLLHTRFCLLAESGVERLQFVDKIHSSLRYSEAMLWRAL